MPRTKDDRRTTAGATETVEQLAERIAPVIERLLADGIPRSRRTITKDLAAAGHPRDHIARTLMRMAVTGRIAQAASGKLTLQEPKGNAAG